MATPNEKRRRKYPGIDRGTLRPDRKAARRESAAARQAAWDAMTLPERARKKRSEGYPDEAERIVGLS